MLIIHWKAACNNKTNFFSSPMWCWLIKKPCSFKPVWDAHGCVCIYIYIWLFVLELFHFNWIRTRLWQSERQRGIGLCIGSLALFNDWPWGFYDICRFPSCHDTGQLQGLMVILKILQHPTAPIEQSFQGSFQSTFVLIQINKRTFWKNVIKPKQSNSISTRAFSFNADPHCPTSLLPATRGFCRLLGRCPSSALKALRAWLNRVGNYTWLYHIVFISFWTNRTQDDTYWIYLCN